MDEYTHWADNFWNIYDSSDDLIDNSDAAEIQRLEIALDDFRQHKNIIKASPTRKSVFLKRELLTQFVIEKLIDEINHSISNGNDLGVIYKSEIDEINEAIKDLGIDSKINAISDDS